jgi:hypothetical protein
VVAYLQRFLYNRVSGISSSFDITPKPENIALKLLMSAWFMAPISGAETRYTAKKSSVPVASVNQAAALKMFIKRNVAVLLYQRREVL